MLAGDRVAFRAVKSPRLLAVVLALALLPLRAALAEAPHDRTSDPWNLGKAVGLPERLSIRISHRTRYEYLGNQFRAGRPGADEVLVLRMLIDTRLRITDWLLFGGEFQDSRLYLADSNTPVDVSEVNAAELLRGYLEFDFAGPFGGTHKVQAGRMTLDVGSRRLVARNRYRNTVNAFTGVDWLWRSEAGHALRAFATLPVQRLPRDEARLKDNDVQFDRESKGFYFWGLLYAHPLPWGDRGELYGFGMHEDDELDNQPGDFQTRNRRLGTPGFRLLRKPEAGRFDYEVESALQFGRAKEMRGVGPALDVLAHMHHLALGYTFDVRWSPRVIAHYVYGSGDQDPDDGRFERFDTLFGARRFEFGPTSIYGAFSRVNINTPGLRFKVKPSNKWSAFIDYRAVWLAEKRDEWFPTGVRDRTGRAGSFVGQQVELRARWRPFPGNVLLELGYAHLFAGSFIDDAPNSNRGDSNYFYTQLVLSL